MSVSIRTSYMVPGFAVGRIRLPDTVPESTVAVTVGVAVAVEVGVEVAVKVGVTVNVLLVLVDMAAPTDN